MPVKGENEHGWLKLSEDGDGLTYRKEILPVGDFEKAEEDLKFTITDEAAKLIVDSSNEMIKNGVASPIVLTHDGQEPYGTNKRFEIDKSEYHDGNAIFQVVRFASRELADKALANDVSAYIPPSFTDGKGRTYLRPIRHTALTPYPVIPNLGRWQPIAASFKTPSLKLEESAVDIDLTPIAEALELDISTEEDPMAQVDMIVAAILELKNVDDPAAGEEEDLPPLSHKVPDLMMSSFINSRRTMIDSLALGDNPVIDVATADKLKLHYCDKDKLALVLSEDKKDDFDFVLSTLKSNSPLKPEGRGDGSHIRLAHGNGEKKSALVKDAEERAEKAKIKAKK